MSGVTVALPAPPVPRQRRPRLANADQLLGGQPVMESFDAVQSILDPGHEVIVRDEEGRATRGRVVSISANQLVIERPRSLFRWRTEERAFPADVVQEIEIVDSWWKGGLIGAAVGAPLLVHSIRFASREHAESLDGLYVMVAAPVVGLAIALGGHIDNSINAPIYERPSQTPRVTIAPSLGQDVIGVSAHVGF